MDIRDEDRLQEVSMKFDNLRDDYNRVKMSMSSAKEYELMAMHQKNPTTKAAFEELAKRYVTQAEMQMRNLQRGRFI